MLLKVNVETEIPVSTILSPPGEKMLSGDKKKTSYFSAAWSIQAVFD